MKRWILFVAVFVVFFFLGGSIVLIKKNIAENLNIKLNDTKIIYVPYGEEYQEAGAKASYKNKDLTDKIKIESDVDTKKLGVYTVTYSIKYMHINKYIKRKVKVVDEEKPSLKLNGDDEIILAQDNEYEEKGALATDNYDGDLTDKIEINKGNFDNTQIGDYTIIYKVKDSSGNENEVQRKVKVVKKAAPDQKVAVLNYHFFYETWDENCHELLCEKMDRFREQLDYLRDNGYYTLTIEEFTKWMYGEAEIPEKSVLITIDDGAHGTSKINGNHLIPALEEYKMHATLFLITGWWDIENYKSDYLDVQSHTNDLHYEAHCGHRSKVNCVSYEELVEDLKKSIEVVKDTNSFCFPFYDYTESSINAVKEVGFKIAFVGGFRKASRNDDKYKIPRYPIYDSTPLSTFINYVS